jgi:alpha-galactosidase
MVPRSARMSYIFVWLCLAVSPCLLLGQQPTSLQSNLAPTPPMGWANWNHYFCEYDDATIRAQARAMVQSGMRDLGYKYLIIQECIAPSRNPEGILVPDAQRFPHGIKSLADYLHSLGLKAGIYTDLGPYTCFDKPQYEGSYEHESQDAETFAAWDIDLIEEDYCNLPKGHTGKELYERMAEEIRKTGRPMLLYICSWGNERPWEWAQGTAQLWRTDADISWEKNHVEWARVVNNFESNARHAIFSAPNRAISAAPLWSGTDLSTMDANAKAIYTNPEVIAVDQDSLGAGPIKVREDASGLQVWDKQLGNAASGRHAVLLVNLTSAAATVGVQWNDLALLPGATVRDLWAKKDWGALKDGYATSIPAHGSVMLTVTGETNSRKGIVYEAEWPGNVRQGHVALLECGECSSAYGVSLGSTLPGEEGSLSFSKVNVPHSGSYLLEIFFVRNGRHHKNVTVQVNGATPVPISVKTFVWGSVDMPVQLKSGDNVVAVRYAGEGSFDLDSIKILPQ